MPYEWIDRPEARDGPPPEAELHLWPYRSLLRRHFVAFMGATAALITVPMLALLGSPIVWGVLPFFLIVFGGLWAALNRSYRDGEVLEELRLWPERVTLTRHNPSGEQQDWEANPHWVRVTLHGEGGPVKHYLTLTGAGRAVEIGAFLSEEERQNLYRDLASRLGAPA